MLVGMRSKTEYAQGENRRELEQLLSGVAAGDCNALEDLYGRTRTAVYGLALSYLKNPQDAQDMTTRRAVPADGVTDGMDLDDLPESLPDAAAECGPKREPQR